jgi:hypothetical protein
MRSAVLRTWRCRLPDTLPGGLVALTLPGMVGKLAYIRTPKRQLDWSAVSAALDLDPFSPEAARRMHAMPGMLFASTTFAGLWAVPRPSLSELGASCGNNGLRGDTSTQARSWTRSCCAMPR